MARSSAETTPGTTFVKRSPDPRPGYFQLEAAGLAWLAEGPARCARVVSVSDTHLELERIAPGAPDARAARRFGGDLATAHDLGADAFGTAPPPFVAETGRNSGDGSPAPPTTKGWFGPLDQPLGLPLEPVASWGEFYGGQRMDPMVRRLRSSGAPASSLDVLERVTEALRTGRFDDGEEPARVHGDLWSGNLMWDRSGAVLIDPAAHGDHREQDLAFLALFGAPYLEEIVAGYESVHRLRPGWRDRVPLHQLFVLAAHAALFDPPRGGGYLRQTERAARSALNLLAG
ncbi:fructosamine kinase [Kocuria coralli]|uniref:Fructosamine kinase n=1 Tax=Kocuria coralli TaxID=1461025 RepID=A0A5J5L118_9MICC|nr:fructosamine kinase family protein [Kocuria coralli]KAA9395637.1 fructosamine kinase [Kocuria coralli]